MTTEEIRRRERIRDLSNFALVQQRINLIKKTRNLSAVKNLATKARSDFRATCNALRLRPEGASLVTLVSKELVDRETAIKSIDNQVHAQMVELERSAVAHKRLETICANLNTRIEAALTAADESAFDAVVEECATRMESSEIAEDGESAEQNVNSLNLTVNNSEKLREVNSARGDHSQSCKDQQFEVATQGSVTVSDLSAACKQKDIDLSKFETWRSFERTGIEVEVGLKNGSKIAMSISKSINDFLSVKILRSSLGNQELSPNLRKEIFASLHAQGLRVKDISVVEKE